MPSGSLPLSALLSQALVAFTIEFDNAAEVQMQHRTTRHNHAEPGVWLTSMAMWLNCMRYVGTELAQLAGQFGPWLPDCLPILGYGLYSRGGGPREDRYREAHAAYEQDREPAGEDVAALPLPWLLARVLLAFAIAYERESRISQAIAANVLRVLDERGARVRDLPELSGVSKEAIAMATNFTGSRDIPWRRPPR